MDNRLFLVLVANCLVLGSISIALSIIWGSTIQQSERFYTVLNVQVTTHKGAKITQSLTHPVSFMPRPTLVVYVYSDTDQQYRHNLEVFIEQGVQKDDTAEYIVVVQMDNLDADTQLPALPPHARYVKHANDCYDWGTIGWLLFNSSAVNYRQYRYFIFVNSSVRGPYMPAYLTAAGFTWTQAFKGMLNDQVKLVGPSISCETSYWRGDVHGKTRHNPHVQSYAIATDRVGLEVMHSTGTVFQCHDRWDAIWFSELGASRAVLAAGYNIASFMARYDGVDFRNRSSWGCNEGASAVMFEERYDGITADPLEMMYVKVKQGLLARSWARSALAYDAWRGGAAGSNSSGNAYLSEQQQHALQAQLAAISRGQRCFDAQLYSTANRLQLPPQQAWRHFLATGLEGSAQFRFTCDDSADALQALRRHMEGLRVG